MMNRFNPILLLVSGAILFGVGMSSCKSRKVVVDEYSYLIKESEVTKEEVVEVEVDEKETEGPVIKTDFRKKVDRAIAEAESYLGTPYRYGGINKNGIDCSGLMHKSYQVVGVALPRSSRDQAKEGKLVKRNKLEPGDLVFFSNKNNGQIDHVGMVTQVVGEEITFIHASTSAGVRFDRMDTGYWKPLFVTARRPTFE